MPSDGGAGARLHCHEARLDDVQRIRHETDETAPHPPRPRTHALKHGHARTHTRMHTHNKTYTYDYSNLRAKIPHVYGIRQEVYFPPVW